MPAISDNHSVITQFQHPDCLGGAFRDIERIAFRTEEFADFVMQVVIARNKHHVALQFRDSVILLNIKRDECFFYLPFEAAARLPNLFFDKFKPLI